MNTDFMLIGLLINDSSVYNSIINDLQFKQFVKENENKSIAQIMKEYDIDLIS